MESSNPDWVSHLDEKDLYCLGSTYWQNDLKFAFLAAANSIPWQGETTSPLEDRGVTLRRAIIKEIRILLCTNESKYEKIRQQFSSQGNIATVIVVATIAAAIAPTVGIAAGAIVAVCSLALAAVCKVGVNAFCEGPVRIFVSASMVVVFYRSSGRRSS